MIFIRYGLHVHLFVQNIVVAMVWQSKLELNVYFDFQIENNKVRAENDKIKEKLNAEISNDENKKVNFSHEKNMAEQKNATLVQVNNLPSHNLNLTSILH